MDADNEGLISKEELFSLFQSVGCDATEDQIEKHIKSGDLNDKG
jgi:Ca2+-binding EF-hand superfamily protein